jgi:septation ring formation regulator EzrA
MWAGFELYQRLLDAEEAIISYVSPDFSHYDESLAVLQTQMAELEKSINKLEEDTEQSLDEFKEDVRGAESLARATDETVADTQRELRDDVYAMEEKLNERMRQMDEDLRTMRSDLEEKIEMILDNPLNDAD